MVPALEEILAATKSMVFFGGAGVSTESGIPDFRSVDGLYHQKFKYPPETMLSHTFYETHTAEFFDFYRQKLIVHGAKPNAAHLRLAALEREGKCKAVVTQNIDGLHQAAGSKTVYELHGSTLRNYCTRCGKFFPVQFIEDAAGRRRRRAPLRRVRRHRQARLLCSTRKGVDEETMENAVHADPRADTLIVGGTSLAVYPAAGLLALLPRGEPCCHQQAAHPGGRNGQSADPRSDWPHAGPRCPR